MVSRRSENGGWGPSQEFLYYFSDPPREKISVSAPASDEEMIMWELSMCGGDGSDTTSLWPFIVMRRPSCPCSFEMGVRTCESSQLYIKLMLNSVSSRESTDINTIQDSHYERSLLEIKNKCCLLVRIIPCTVIMKDLCWKLEVHVITD